MKRTDSEIQQAVVSELKWDTHVEGTDVGVVVDAGVVTLAGKVGSWAAVRLSSPQARAAMGSALLRSPSPRIPHAYIANDSLLRRSFRCAPMPWNDSLYCLTLGSFPVPCYAARSSGPR